MKAGTKSAVSRKDTQILNRNVTEILFADHNQNKRRQTKQNQLTIKKIK